MSILGFIYEMITVCFIKRKGINSHFWHLKFHCLYDMQHHCRCQSITLNLELLLLYIHVLGYVKGTLRGYCSAEYVDSSSIQISKGFKSSNDKSFCQVDIQIILPVRWMIFPTQVDRLIKSVRWVMLPIRQIIYIVR